MDELFENKCSRIERFPKYTSFGIIPIILINENLYFVLIQRKETISFVIFNKNKLEKMKCDPQKEIARMTIEEKKYLLDTYEWSKNKKISGELYNNIEKYKEYIKDISNSGELEWFFPKGRRNNNREPGYFAAIREFYEETNFNKCIKKIFIDHSISCVKYGTDKKKYMYVLYPALVDISKTPFNDTLKNVIPVNSNEVSNVGLFDIDELYEKIDHIIPNITDKILDKCKEIDLSLY